MSDWIPKRAEGVDLKSLPLTPMEGFILSRVDGSTSLKDLASVAGMSPERVEEIVFRLVAEGALESPPSEEPDSAAPDEAPASSPGSATQRQLYESALRGLPEEEREARARTATEPELSAWCFDPLPRVIHALLENPHTGLTHARLIAAHHRTPAGLEMLAGRNIFWRDPEVQRQALRNPQLPVALLRRTLSPKRLVEIFKAGVSRDLPEQNRRAARDLLRTRFATGQAEERVELIFQTEGRALLGLSGVPIDNKTTALLCGRTYHSTLLIQNLARWSSTPPALIAHLLKQPVVSRQPQLKALLAARK